MALKILWAILRVFGSSRYGQYYSDEPMLQDLFLLQQLSYSPGLPALTHFHEDAVAERNILFQCPSQEDDYLFLNVSPVLYDIFDHPLGRNHRHDECY